MDRHFLFLGVMMAEEHLPDIEDEPAPEAAAPETPVVQTVPLASNYHISLWDEPPTYLCLICIEQPPVKRSLAEVQAHVITAHGIEAVPTPMAANPSTILPTVTEETRDAPEPDVLRDERHE